MYRLITDVMHEGKMDPACVTSDNVTIRFVVPARSYSGK